MIPTKTDIEIQGSLPGEDVQMTLDTGSLAHLMSVLTNLYSNKTLAIVREYSTNALDSHIESGNTDPIQVTTPTDFQPYFTVRDFGVGMDAETIRNVYSRYGASTKRGTNSQNGMLGLGSKSALTYTSQFNITGVKDGIKTYVVVSRSADGSGVMKIISQSNTTEPNGVTISIPVTNRRDIENVAHGFFRFWKPGTVLLNGKDPSALEGLQLGRFTVTDQINGDHIVMGNVAYPLPADNRIFKTAHSRTSVVAYVDMGEVNFTPSRESLHMTSLTKATLDNLRIEFGNLVRAHIEEKIDKAPSHAEAVKNYFEIQKTNLSVYASSIKYKGEEIPYSTSFTWLYNLGMGTTYSAHHIEFKKMFYGRIAIVHGYEYAKIHSNHRKKLRLFLDEKKLDSTTVYFTKEVKHAKWLEDIPQFSWEEVSAVKLNLPKAAGSSSDLYDAIDGLGYRISNQKIDLTKKIVYASPTMFASEDIKDQVARFLTNQPDVQLVLVNKNKWKSFKTEIPKAVYIEDAVKQAVNDYVNGLTNEEKVFLRSNWKDRNFCAKLNASKVADPAISTAIKALRADGVSEKTAKKYEIMRDVAVRWGITGFPNFLADSERLFEAYPLLNVYSHSSIYNYPIEHVYMYINTVYRTKQKP